MKDEQEEDDGSGEKFVIELEGQVDLGGSSKSLGQVFQVQSAGAWKMVQSHCDFDPLLLLSWVQD